MAFRKWLFEFLFPDYYKRMVVAEMWANDLYNVLHPPKAPPSNVVPLPKRGPKSAN